MAQELFRGYSRDTGNPKYALKIDLHKAFDSVSWSFIIKALERLFPCNSGIGSFLVSPQFATQSRLMVP